MPLKIKHDRPFQRSWVFEGWQRKVDKNENQKNIKLHCHGYNDQNLLLFDLPFDTGMKTLVFTSFIVSSSSRKPTAATNNG